MTDNTKTENNEVQNKVFLYISTNSPSGMGQITSGVNDIDENLVKAAVAALLSKGSIEKRGEKRGTKYAPKDFDWNSPGAQKETPKFRDQVIEALTKLGSKTSLKKISEFCSVEPNQLRDSLKSLISDDTVVQHGSKRGATYSLANMTTDDQTDESNDEVTVEASTEVKNYDSIDEFCEVAVQFIDRKKEFDHAEISKALVAALPGSTVNGDPVSEYEASKFVSRLVTNKKLFTRTVNQKLAYVKEA